MSIRKIRASWWVDFRVNHVRYRLRSPENSQGGAKAYEALLRHRLAMGQPIKPEEPKAKSRTFASFSKEWFDTYVRTNNKLGTQRLRKRTLDSQLVPAFGHLNLDEIDVASIENYKREKLTEGLASSTINLYIAVLAKCLHDAMEWGLLERVPRIRMLKQARHAFDFLSHSEAELLVSSMKTRQLRAMATIALNTGMRVGELCGLQWGDIDLKTRRLVVKRTLYEGTLGMPKNNKERHIPLSIAAEKALASLPQDDDFVFHVAGGGPVDYCRARRGITAACKRAGLRQVGWHVLRHTFASWLVADGVPLSIVQALLGHAKIEMTLRYAHLGPSSLRSAIDLLERQLSSARAEYSWATGGQRAWETNDTQAKEMVPTTRITSPDNAKIS